MKWLLGLLAVLTFVAPASCLFAWVWTGEWRWAPSAVLAYLICALVGDVLEDLR